MLGISIAMAAPLLLILGLVVLYVRKQRQSRTRHV